MKTKVHISPDHYVTGFGDLIFVNGEKVALVFDSRNTECIEEAVDSKSDEEPSE